MTTDPNSDLLDRILERLRRARAIQLVGHVHPDGDCIGSLLAMGHLLDQFGTPHAFAAPRLAAGGYDRMPGFDRIRPDPDPDLNPDLAVYLDTAGLERGIEGWRPKTPIINIDHHAGNTNFGQINWIDPEAAATGEMVYRLARHGDADLTPPLAEALLVALTTDTGSFRFSSTGAAQHRMAAELIEAGASPASVSRIAFNSQPLQALRLKGRVLDRLRLEAGGRLAWSELRAADYETAGGEDQAPENLASALRSIRGVAVGILFHELPDGSMRVNFRSDTTIDVRRLAERWGGGGHAAAAGLTLGAGDYERRRDQILAAAAALVNEE